MGGVSGTHQLGWWIPETLPTLLLRVAANVTLESIMIKHALKEWAVICHALATGKQAVILRKGGIEETSGEFKLEHSRFWLYPTYVHQQSSGIKPDAAPLLEQVEKARPPHGTIRIQHFAEAAGVYDIHDIVGVLKINSLHIWSEETAQSRFKYRRPGLYAIPLRVYQMAQAIEFPEAAHYAGCKSWVELDGALPTDGAVPVLDEESFRDVLRKLDVLLNPTAFA